MFHLAKRAISFVYAMTVEKSLVDCAKSQHTAMTNLETRKIVLVFSLLTHAHIVEEARIIKANKIAEEMSDALIMVCPYLDCGLRFFKEEACNHVQCSKVYLVKA